MTESSDLAIAADMKDYSRFKELLDSRHQWPGDYTFKFVCRPSQVNQLSAMFHPAKLQLKSSSHGNYVSVTVTLLMDSSAAVIAIYEKAALLVPGLISL